MAFQNGKVTAVSSTSITLHSADGYSHTYVVTSSTLVNAQRDGIGSVKVGNQAVVDATVSGSTTTAVRILDLSQLQKGFHRFFAPPPAAASSRSPVGKLRSWQSDDQPAARRLVAKSVHKGLQDLQEHNNVLAYPLRLLQL